MTNDAFLIYDPLMLHSLLLLAGVMVAMAVVACGGLIVAMARMLLMPKRMTAGRALYHLHRLNPSDLGMEYEPCSFQVIDESGGGRLNLAAWWIPTPVSDGRCAIILHGFSDAKVGAIAWAPLLRSFGFNILAVDLRAHGESGGKYTTAGFWERNDISQVIDQLKAARPQETQRILLFGVSLGAAIASATAAIRDDLWAVILESPFSSFHDAAFHHGDRLGTPGPIFQETAYRLGQWLAHADFDAVRPTETIRKIRCPLLIVQSGDDPFVSEADQQAVRQAVESRDAKLGYCTCWRLPGVHHVVGLSHDPEEYRQQIQEFFSRCLQSTVQVCEK